MALNLDVVGVASEPAERSWTSTDTLLYALGVGAGSLAPDEELEFTTENCSERPQRVLPTFAAVIGGGTPRGLPIGSFDPALLLHGEQGIELFGAIAPRGTVSASGVITGIYDKGSGALVVTESTARDVPSGRPVWKTTNALFVRGEGGFGGAHDPSGGAPPWPVGPPDHEITYATRADQALLYRLSGDRNPLHSDPAFARRAGFDRPILHGLCTYGFTGRALLHTLCGSDVERFRAMHGRFTRPTYPGESLTISLWVDGSTARFRTVSERGETVIDRGEFRFD